MSEVPDLAAFVEDGKVPELPRAVRVYRRLSRDFQANWFRAERRGISMSLVRQATLVCEARGGRELRWDLDENEARVLIAHLQAAIHPAFVTQDEAESHARARGFTDGCDGSSMNWSSPYSYSTAYYEAYLKSYGIGADARRARIGEQEASDAEVTT